ncbi:ABC transporter substrate-binding protein [Pyrolobus fumarii]|uniref:ABC transporter substrate-binding protein n=1 Tax=Pyrolobus fumarii TaxID=54252 RepID=UPI00143327B4|nr:ABC transporter substrate-binding protein [Pyrolobus fumarii]
MQRLMAALVLLLITIPTLGILVHAQGQEQLVEKIVVMRITEDDPAIQSLLSGDTQARLFRIRDPNLAKKMMAQGFKVVAPLSGLVDILVNPVQCRDGSFNPFTIPEVRYALNFIINRKEIANEIYKGAAVPAIIPYSEVDPDYIKLLPVAAKYEVEFAKGFEYAKKLITEAMEKAGAKLVDGKWYYNGKPVTIKFVIRIEDERKQVGEYVAKKLEELGFTVEKIYKDFRGAFDVVYGDDPGKCQWHLYTEGWGFTGMTAYDHDTAVAFFSSLYGFQPGWGEASYVNYYPPKEINDTAEKLVKGEYKTPEEYWALYRKLVDLGIRDSVRVFVVWTRDFYIINPNVKGIIESPKASPWNTWTYLNLHYTGPEVKFSNRYVYSQGWPWNPVGGFQDLYSVTSVATAIYLPGITSKPTTGEPGWSLIASFKVERGNPVVKVPEDAITWDPEKHAWVSAGGKVAKNAVVINYKLLGKLKFHDGSTETIADLLAMIYLIKEWSSQAGEGDTRYESALASQYAPFLTNFVAVKVINETAVIVYTNFTHMDDGIVAQQADIWTGTPLELYLAMEKLVEAGEAAFTMSGAKAANKPAVHLVSKDQCEKMAAMLREIIEKKEMPDWVKGLIDLGYLTADEFYKRLENLLNFYEKYGHMLVGNGPFMLESYDAANDVATLVRVPDYPISPEQVAKELGKHVARVEAVQLINEGIIEVAEPGTPVAKIKVSVDGKPAAAKAVKVYAMAVSEKGDVVMLDAKYVKPGIFEIVLKKPLPEGDYKLVIYVYPAGYSQPAKAIASITVLMAPEETTTTTTTPATETVTTTKPAETAAPATTTVTVTKTTTETVVKTSVSTVTTTVTETVQTGNTGMMAAAAVAALIVGLAIGYLVKRS